eukprot:gnl/TRDRNA2_/TRDRNA2_82313_c0_seq1.p1 gnl/TRDRNA2_/TRDRNA2_82313_c0~~gnl/TRDRNA2_/TRDRNA2_82313_c0_seq1.p1  ORF type:complete len:323 (+),score=45.82 gnl/TRDRNA2_/TRDRNA2_82313_c0_seq1:68-970(+)
MLATQRVFFGPPKKIGESSGRFLGLADIDRADLSRFLLLGALTACNVTGFTLAAKRLPPITVSIFNAMMPVITAVCGSCLGVELLSPAKILCVLCAFIGSVIVVTFGRKKHSDHVEYTYSSGVPFMLMSIVCYSLWAVFQRSLLKKYAPIFVGASGFLFAAGPIFAVVLCTDGWESARWAMGEGNPNAMRALVYAIICTTSLNYSIAIWANKHTSPTSVMAVISTQPFSTVLVSWLLLDEMPNSGQWIGGVCILLGVFAFIREQMREPLGEAQPLQPSSKQDVEDPVVGPPSWRHAVREG